MRHLRAECLDAHWFTSLTEAQQIVETWRREYNESRPHRALGERTPHEFANEIAASRDFIGIQLPKTRLSFGTKTRSGQDLEVLGWLNPWEVEWRGDFHSYPRAGVSVVDDPPI